MLRSILTVRPEDAAIDPTTAELMFTQVLDEHGLASLGSDDLIPGVNLMLHVADRGKVIVAMHQYALAADERVHDLMRERDTLREAVTEANRQTTDIRIAHQRFRTQVRDVAIEVADEQGWCDDGLNERLEQLGLDPRERPYTVGVTVTLSLEIEEAVNQDSAEDQAKDLLSDMLSGAENWNLDAIDSERREG